MSIGGHGRGVLKRLERLIGAVLATGYACERKPRHDPEIAGAVSRCAAQVCLPGGLEVH